MTPEHTDAAVRSFALLWLVIAGAVFVRQWWRDTGVGLLLTYVLSLSAMHWLAALTLLLPDYRVRHADLTLIGLRESTFGLLAFVVGTEIAGAARRRQLRPGLSRTEPAIANRRLVNVYLLVGVLLYAIIAPLTGRIPTVAALASMASPLIVSAFGLKCWNAYASQQPQQLPFWLVASLGFPVLTVVTQGFLGFGFAAMCTLFALVASFYRPRWPIVVASVILVYVGLSVYVTYMRDRTDIRQVVWGGDSYSARLDRVAATVSEFEWFDPQNQEHLDRINGRLNQNYFVGVAVERLDNRSTSFAHGETLWEAALALVPRAFWSNKPVFAGSGDLVSIYTGLYFPPGTSVGIGHVMELYVNFGRTGVVLGFLVIGMLLAHVDWSARRHLQGGDVARFVLWYLPGLGLLLVGGSFVEMVGTSVAGLVVGVALKRFTDYRFRDEAGPRLPVSRDRVARAATGATFAT